jgi:hypothetical protein
LTNPGRTCGVSMDRPLSHRIRVLRDGLLPASTGHFTTKGQVALGTIECGPKFDVEPVESQAGTANLGGVIGTGRWSSAFPVCYDEPIERMKDEG